MNSVEKEIFWKFPRVLVWAAAIIAAVEAIASAASVAAVDGV